MTFIVRPVWTSDTQDWAEKLIRKNYLQLRRGFVMKAAVMTEFRQPLKIMDLPDPTPGPDSALIRVEACGICRSDWHLWQGDWAWMGIQPALPLVMGHELAGVVESVGADVHTFRAGDASHCHSIRRAGAANTARQVDQIYALPTVQSVLISTAAMDVWPLSRQPMRTLCTCPIT